MSCQNSLFCASTMLSRSVSSVTGKRTAQGRPFLVITTDRSDGNSLTILLRFALTSRRLSIFTAQTPSLRSKEHSLSSAQSAQLSLPCLLHGKTRATDQREAHNPRARRFYATGSDCGFLP